MFSLIGVLPGEMDPVEAYEIGSRKGVFAYHLYNYIFFHNV